MSGMFISTDERFPLNRFGDIVQVLLHILILCLSIVYIVLILINKHFRQAKLIWPTINICLATIFFCLNQLILLLFRLENSTMLNIPCRLQGFFMDFTACHMMYAHSISAINRFLAIRYFQKPLYRSQRWLLITITTGWLIALIMAVPYLFYDGFSCPLSSQSDLFTIYSCISTLILPAGVVGVCNLLIFSYLRQSSRRVHQIDHLPSSNAHPLNKRDLHLSKIMLISFCIFILGWTPLFLEQLLIDVEHQVPLFVTVIVRINLPVCLLCDMILLVYFNQPVRQFIQKLCRCDRIVPRKFTVRTH